jgi:hypothetical protein
MHQIIVLVLSWNKNMLMPSGILLSIFLKGSTRQSAITALLTVNLLQYVSLWPDGVSF